MSQRTHLSLILAAAAVLAGWFGPGAMSAKPQGEITYAMHVTLAPALR